MDDLYWIGVLVGIGTALGVLFAALLATSRAGVALAAVLAAGAGVLAGFGLGDWPGALAGGVGGLAGSLGAARLVTGALRRGGTRWGTATLLAGAAAGLGALAFVPALGYLAAVSVPLVGARLHRQAGRRYAGLRVLR